MRCPPHGRVADEDERPGGRVDLLPADRERGVTREHHVELLVAAGGAAALVVVLDELVACVRGRVRVHAEGLDPEGAAHGPPDERIRDRHRLDLGDMDGREGVGHDAEHKI
jgi:hypothetical protein